VAALALFVLEDEPFTHRQMDEAHLKATHLAIFGELYEWAGFYRENTGIMTKARDAGYTVRYGDSAHVPAEMQRIFVELKREEYLKGLALNGFAERLAYFYGELDGSHPFREGNSRTLRKFASDLARAAGYELDWEPSGRNRQSRDALYIARDYAAHHRQYEHLIAIVRANLRPLIP
jgi:fido (protein-threonine AMPylation protein)